MTLADLVAANKWALDAYYAKFMDSAFAPRSDSVLPSDDGDEVFEIDLETEVPEVEPERVEIGCFGRPEHLTAERLFEDCWMDNEGSIQIRRIPVPDTPFYVTSAGSMIYEWDGFNGTWHSSEKTRRE